MSVTRASWAHSLLSGLNVPTTTTNVQIIVGWTLGENSGTFGQDGNIAYNPLNTIQQEPGSTNAGAQGNIQSYANWAQGLAATITTLNNGYYASILSMLQSGTATAAQAAATINGSVWGTKDMTAALISGADTSTATTGTGVPSTSGGGIYGLGGTGTSANTPATSLWIVGDSSNPDQDYWTTINQYAQDAQWYAFSDGETLFIADGFKIMGQTPQAVIVRVDPRVLTANGTYDNSTWNYTHTHVAKAKIVRRAALAKVVSPTEVEINVICDIDQFRGGDTVYLKMFGPFDGIWLISESRRPLFRPYSTLTLVQGMQPINASSGLALGPAYLTGNAATAAGSGTVIAAMVSKAATINNDDYSYVYGGGHAAAGTPSGGGFDCSGSVAAVLAAGGLWPTGSTVPGSTGIVNQLLSQNFVTGGSGTGSPECTLFDIPNHILMRLNGQYWGTGDPVGGLPDTPNQGPGWIPNGGFPTGYRVTHVPASILGQQASGASAATSGATGSPSISGPMGFNVPQVNGGSPSGSSNQMVQFYQADPRWANAPYGAGKTDIGASGCGITCAAMIVDTLAGAKETPLTLANKYGAAYHIDGTSWALWPQLASDYHLSEVDIGAGSDFTAAQAAIQAGGLVVCSFGPGAFTSEGHFMIMRAITSDGSFYFADPNGLGEPHGLTEGTAYTRSFILSSGNLLQMWTFES